MANIDIIILFVLITERAIVNSTPGRSGTSYPAQRLLEDSEKFLLVRDSVLVEALLQSLDGVGQPFNFEIIASFSVFIYSICCLRTDFFAGSLRSSIWPLSLHNFLFFGGGSSRDNSKMSEFHDILADAKPSI